MKIFISWSGERSRQIATLLKAWIPDVLQNARPWMSQSDIAAGQRWSLEIARELGDTSFGILCVTRENPEHPWLVFEAGALAKSLTESRVCPYLFGLRPQDLPDGPLTQFQAKPATKEGTWDLLKALNSGDGSASLPEERIQRAFEQWWPSLEGGLAVIRNESLDGKQRRRNMEEMVGELLERVRSLDRRLVAMQNPSVRRQVGSPLVMRVRTPPAGERSPEFASQVELVNANVPVVLELIGADAEFASLSPTDISFGGDGITLALSGTVDGMRCGASIEAFDERGVPVVSAEIARRLARAFVRDHRKRSLARRSQRSAKRRDEASGVERASPRVPGRLSEPPD